MSELALGIPNGNCSAQRDFPRELDRLYQLLSGIPAGVYACDAEGHITFYNRRAAELWGREPKLNDLQEKFCACSKVFLLDGTFVPPDQTPMAMALREGKPARDLEAIVIRPDGSKFFALVNIDVLHDEAGRICGAVNVFQDITKLKESTYCLKVQERHLRAVVNNTPECVKIVANDGTLREMNGAGLCLVEAESRELVIGQCVYDLIAPEFRDDFRAMNERVCGGRKEKLEFQIVGLKGTRRWMETNATPIIDPSTGGLAQLAITRDISQRKEAEQALQESEEKYRALFDSIDQGFCTVQVLFDEEQKPVDYRFLMVNAAFERQTGISNAVGRRMREIAPLHEEHWFEIYGKIALTGESMRFENPAAELNRFYEVYAWRVGSPEQCKVAILFSDITKRRQAEESLRQSELRWRTMAEALPNLVWTDLPDGTCDWLSSQWGRYTGIPEGQLLGLKWLDKVIHPDDRERTLACWRAACEGRGDYDLEYSIRRYDGEYRLFKTRGVPIRDESGKIVYWFGTCTDIEDVKRAQERERSLIERTLTATAKFEAVFNQSGLFAGIMDLDGSLLEVNDLAVSACGYTKAQVLNQPFWETPWWRGSEQVRSRIRAAFRQAAAGNMFRETLRYWVADGTERLVDFSMHPIRDKSGQIRFLHPTGVDITEQERIKSALQLSEERFRLASFSDAITLYEQDSELRYTWLYPLHPEHEQAMGNSDSELLPNEQGKSLVQWKREVMATGQPLRREVRTDLSTGARTYDVFIGPKRNAAGEIVGVSGTALDITERKRAETALRDSEERFRAVIDNSPTIIFVKDCEGRYLLINQRYKELFHTTEEAFVGKTDFGNFPAEIAQKYRDNDLIVMRTGQALQAEEVAVHEDGPHTYISIKFPLRRADGSIYAIAGISNDITDRKHAEESAARLAAIVEHSNDAIISKDLDGIIKSWNAGAERLFGYTAEEAIGQPVTILIPEDRLHEEAGILDKIRNGESIENYETIRCRKGGRLLDISLTVSAIKDKTGKVIGVSKVARDITDKVRAKEKLEQTVAERTASLREAIAQMEEFSYTVSHDLRAPLRGMKVYSEVLLEDFAPTLSKEARRCVERIAASTKQMDKMVLDVLTFSRVARTDFNLEMVAVDKLARQIIEQYPGMQAPKAEIRIETLPDVLGHEPSLTQAFSNLLNNAVKFVAPGVMPKVRIWSETKNGYVRFWIADNGIGIDPRYHHRLFSMFERIHPNLKYDGTGVGLAIVKKAVDRMGGRVGIESEGVNGTRFWIELRAAGAL